MPDANLPNGPYWIRIHIRTGNLSHPGLLLGPIASVYEGYWDGRKIAKFGDFARERGFIPRWQTYALPRDLVPPGLHVLTIRIVPPFLGFGTRPARLSPEDNRVGDLDPLHEAQAAFMRADFRPALLQLLVDFTLLVAGLYYTLLPPAFSEGHAFRWLGVFLWGRALVVMCEFYANYGPLDVAGNVLDRLVWIAGSLSFFALAELPYALFRRAVPFAIRLLQAFFLAGVLLFWQIPYQVRFFAFLVASFVSVAVAFLEWRKRTPDAGVALSVFAIAGLANLVTVLAIDFQLPLPMAIDLAGFRVWLWDASLVFCMPAIAVLIHRMNLRFRADRDRLQGEMQAARSVQEVLIPSHAVQVPGFTVDASYRPAMEVGGDFFQIFRGQNDSLLVIVGDVSGKGMKAALLVSLIVGALRNRASDQPAPILAALNSVLLGSSEGGFTTCCCALFTPDGNLTLANAGHPAPYRNGKEIALDPGLPLGLAPDVQWTETRCKLGRNDRIVFLSDGIIEARNSKRELLGFHRAQELAVQPAAAIARAAEQFGQQDDITVISIARQPLPA